MVSRNKKILKDINGNEYRFNYEKFQKCIKEYKDNRRSNKEKCTNDIVFEMISEKVDLTYDAVRNWYYDHNGPSDIEIVNSIATVLEVEPFDILDPLNAFVPQNSEIEEKRRMKEMQDTIALEIEKRMITLDAPCGNSEEVVKSIIYDMLEYINQMDKSDCFTYVPGITKKWSDTQLYYLQWGNEIRLKINKAAFLLTSEHYRKLDQLLSETMMITCDADYSSRWVDINRCFEYFFFQFQEDIGEYSFSETLEDDSFCYEFGIDEVLRKALIEDFRPFTLDSGVMVSMPIEKIVSMRIGKWFMDVVRHDFPELFF